jgi:predicted phage tail protein
VIEDFSPLLSGAGGGSSDSNQPKIKKDTLGNNTWVQLLDLWSEGEIEGFATAAQSGYARGSVEYNRAALKDLFLDKTPILQATADVASEPPATAFNFQNITTEYRWGTQNQEPIRAFPQVETEIAVGVLVTVPGPVTRRVTDSDVDAVRVTLSWQALQFQQEDGDIVGDTVRWQIQLSNNGGPFVVAYEGAIENQRSADPFQVDQIVNLTGPFPVDVRVVRITADSTNALRQNAFSWSSYTLIKYARMRYPNSAYAYLRFSAKDFSSIPLRSYRLRLLKIKIPSNGTVEQSTGRVTYSGVWDGTFSAAQWCSDPAWVLWDLLTSDRYGFGKHIRDENVDKWSFYAASQYCSELVADGNGGMEPRFSCNVLIQNLTDAYKLINDLASVMRCMPYWSAGGIMLSQDRPADPAYLFSQDNIDGSFSYSGSSLTQRHSVASVAWLNLDEQEVAYEVVMDDEAVFRFGVITAEVVGFACTSRGQAARLGRMILTIEQNETEVVTFRTALDSGVQVRPGMVVSIADPMRTGARQGGRIQGGTTSEVVLDVPVSSLPPATTPQIAVLLTTGLVETREVASSSGSTVTLASPLSAAPLVNGPYIYSETQSLWRVLGVKEDDRTAYQIVAMTYNPTKYDFVERDLPLGSTTFPPVEFTPPPPAESGGDDGLTGPADDGLTEIIEEIAPVTNGKRLGWGKGKRNQ